MGLRILFLTNLYPPASNGGFEQWCQEMAEGLWARGHQVHVLTSRYAAERISQEAGWIRRSLHMEMKFGSRTHSIDFFRQRKKHEQENLRILREVLDDFSPELAVIWGMWNLPRSLAAELERQLPGRVAYYIGDYWPTLPSQHQFFWDSPARNWFTRLPKALLKPFAKRIMMQEVAPELLFERLLFPSHFMLEEYQRLGMELKDAQVIAGAIETTLYTRRNGNSAKALPQNANDNRNQQSFSLLYAGRLSPEKGIETAIQAMEYLVCQHGLQEVHLAILGGGEHGYVNRLREMVRVAGLEQQVHFQERVEKEAMPEIYRQYDVFLFPSTWKEPFGRVIVEALASGLAVIGTATGGAREILQPEENALLFTPGDPQDMARQILRLMNEPDLRDRLVTNGRRTAVEKFDITRMVDEIEAYLQGMLVREGS